MGKKYTEYRFSCPLCSGKGKVSVKVLKYFVDNGKKSEMKARSEEKMREEAEESVKLLRAILSFRDLDSAKEFQENAKGKLDLEKVEEVKEPRFDGDVAHCVCELREKNLKKLVKKARKVEIDGLNDISVSIFLCPSPLSFQH